MKKFLLVLFIALSFKSFAQDLKAKIKLFETNLNHWDTLKTKTWTLKERMAFYEVNAVSIAVIKDYKIEWTKAYGYADVSEHQPATTQTLFQAASISKSINSLGILKLVQEGKLALDTDINTYLKDWRFPYDSISNGKKITISQLLSHTAGLSVGGFGGYAQGETLPTTIQTLDGLAPSNSNAVRSIFAPGLQFEYSGGGVTITQLILENITNESYEDYMTKNVLIPLGMTHSSFNQPPSKDQAPLLATGYNGSTEVTGKYHIYPEKAAAGLWTNPTDLAKYIIETQHSLEGNSNKIISKELSEQRIDGNLGVFKVDFNGAVYFAHNGSNEGFVCTSIGSVTEGNGIVVMTNGTSGTLMNEIVASIASLNHWKNYPLESQKESIAMSIKNESENNIDKGIALYTSLKKNNPEDYNFSDESELNRLGYQFLQTGKTAAAIKIFELNVEQFPNSANVYDSSAEAYFQNKDYQASKTNYLKSLELNPNNQNARDMLLKIEEQLKN